MQFRSVTGEFTATIDRLSPNDEFEFRAVVKHPLVTLHGEEKVVASR
jgi:hypothetical protein